MRLKLVRSVKLFEQQQINIPLSNVRWVNKRIVIIFRAWKFRHRKAFLYPFLSLLVAQPPYRTDETVTIPLGGFNA